MNTLVRGEVVQVIRDAPWGEGTTITLYIPPKHLLTAAECDLLELGRKVDLVPCGATLYAQHEVGYE